MNPRENQSFSKSSFLDKKSNLISQFSSVLYAVVISWQCVVVCFFSVQFYSCSPPFLLCTRTPISLFPFLAIRLQCSRAKLSAAAITIVTLRVSKVVLRRAASLLRDALLLGTGCVPSIDDGRRRHPIVTIFCCLHVRLLFYYLPSVRISVDLFITHYLFIVISIPHFCLVFYSVLIDITRACQQNASSFSYLSTHRTNMASPVMIVITINQRDSAVSLEILERTTLPFLQSLLDWFADGSILRRIQQCGHDIHSTNVKIVTYNSHASYRALLN